MERTASRFSPLPGSRVAASPPVRVRRVIGIDPGLASTGYGVIEYQNNRYRYICHGVIETSAGIPRQERLVSIFNELSQVLSQYNPEEAGMETLYFAKNVSSAMAVAEARGVISLCIAQKGIVLGEYTPLVIKQSVVGAARAAKKEVQEYVRLLLGLEDIPEPNHAADALAAAITRIHSSADFISNSLLEPGNSVRLY